MKIAALSDIHGNLGALDAVLADIDRRHVDVVVNLGDILSGPLQPRETADRLMQRDFRTIRGNHERQLLAQDRKGMGASDLHAAQSITDSQRSWLAGLPPDLWLEPDIFMCHATPLNDVDCFLEDICDGEFIPAPLPRIEERVGNCRATLILCGHTHIPKVAQVSGGRVIVNPGSVGIQAYEGHHPVPHTLEMGAPHARYAVLERTISGWIAELIAVPYDWESAARLAERNRRPEWARALRTGFIREVRNNTLAPACKSGESIGRSIDEAAR